MVEQKSSFIPTTPVRAAVSAKARSRKVYMLTYVSFVLFFGTVIATGIVFFIGLQEQRNLDVQKTRLDQEFNQFDGDGLAEVQELSVRLTEAKKLVDQGVSPAGILAALEVATVKSVTISSFTFTKQDDGRYLLELTATTPDLNTIRYQRDIIAGNPVLAGASIEQTIYGSPSSESENSSQSDTSSDEGIVNFTISKLLSVEDIPHRATAVVNHFADADSNESVPVSSADSSISTSDAGTGILSDSEPLSNLEADTINE